MSTLVEVLSGASAANALTGVKRPLLGNPTTVPTQQPAFRGAPNEPGKAIKVPKLSGGNRQDRGTNVTIPVARVTPLTSIHINNGRLSPGDVCFVRRVPGGYTGALKGSSKMHDAALGGHMCDMLGIDGVNRLLAGSLDGTRPWRLGYNLVNGNANLPTTGAPPKVDGVAEDTLRMLKVLEMHTLDGIVLSNEEPHSFSTTGERDATIFNVAVQGPAATNNGFLNYESHSGMELYARGYDAHAFHETVPVTSERSGLTWHGKIGYDFVAAFTNHYTQFPLQMFDRHPQVLDRAYVILRRYNLWDDVIVPHAARTASSGGTIASVKARLKVVDGMNDDAPVNLTTLSDDELKKMYFFQYMPCTSRAFQIYKYNKIRASKAYSSISSNLTWKEEKMDAVRDADIENCVGAWCLGKIIDPYMARAPRFSGGPVNSSYRIEVNVKVQWMPRNKQYMKNPTSGVSTLDYKMRFEEDNTKIYKPYMYTLQDRIRGSQARSSLLRPDQQDLHHHHDRHQQTHSVVIRVTST